MPLLTPVIFRETVPLRRTFDWYITIKVPLRFGWTLPVKGRDIELCTDWPP